MKLEATQDNVVLRPIKAKRETQSGIMLPDACQEPYEDGAEIIHVGPDVQGLAVGDVVVRPDPPRYEVIDDETKEVFWLAAEDDILAKIV